MNKDISIFDLTGQSIFDLTGQTAKELSEGLTQFSEDCLLADTEDFPESYIAVANGIFYFSDSLSGILLELENNGIKPGGTAQIRMPVEDLNKRWVLYKT